MARQDRQAQFCGVPHRPACQVGDFSAGGRMAGLVDQGWLAHGCEKLRFAVEAGPHCRAPIAFASQQELAMDGTQVVRRAL